MFLFADPFPCFSFRVEGLDDARLSAFLGHFNVTSRSPLVMADSVGDFGHRPAPVLAPLKETYLGGKPNSHGLPTGSEVACSWKGRRSHLIDEAIVGALFGRLK
jgi:hypothetical protein